MFNRFSNAFDTVLRIQRAVEASRNTDFFGLEVFGHLVLFLLSKNRKN